MQRSCEKEAAHTAGLGRACQDILVTQCQMFLNCSGTGQFSCMSERQAPATWHSVPRRQPGSDLHSSSGQCCNHASWPCTAAAAWQKTTWTGMCQVRPAEHQQKLQRLSADCCSSESSLSRNSDAIAHCAAVLRSLSNSSRMPDSPHRLRKRAQGNPHQHHAVSAGMQIRGRYRTQPRGHRVEAIL